MTSLPGLHLVLRDYVLTELMKRLYIPYGIEMPLGTVSVSAGTKAEHGVGLLRVHVRRAIGLPQQAMTVQTALGFARIRPITLVEVIDPTATGRSAVHRVHSLSVAAPINPVWDERLEVLVPSFGAVLRLSVVTGNVGVDADVDVQLLGRAGDIVVDGDLRRDACTHCATALSTSTGSVGTLQVDLEWKPFDVPFVSTPRPLPTAAGSKVFDWSVGVIFVTLVGVRGLESSGSVSHVKVTTGGETRQTRCRKGANPDFNANFHFLVQYVPQQKVGIVVVDHQTGDAIGDLSFNVSDVVNSGGKQAGTWDLHGSDHGKVELSLQFRGVSACEANPDNLFVKASATECSASAPSSPLLTQSTQHTMGNSLRASAIFHDANFNLFAAAAGVAMSRIGVPDVLTPSRRLSRQRRSGRSSASPPMAD